MTLVIGLLRMKFDNTPSKHNYVIMRNPVMATGKKLGPPKSLGFENFYRCIRLGEISSKKFCVQVKPLFYRPIDRQTGHLHICITLRRLYAMTELWMCIGTQTMLFVNGTC